MSSVDDPDLSNNSSSATVDIVQSAPPVTQAPPPVTLPKTGSDTPAIALRYALLLVGAGAAFLLVSRRRRTVP